MTERCWIVWQGRGCRAPAALCGGVNDATYLSANVVELTPWQGVGYAAVGSATFLLFSFVAWALGRNAGYDKDKSAIRRAQMIGMYLFAGLAALFAIGIFLVALILALLP